MIIDLSHPIRDGIQTFPGGWHPNVAIQSLGRLSVEGRRSTKIQLGSHTATHIDAPSHFLENGADIDRMPLDLFYGEALVVNFQHISDGAAVSGEAMTAALPINMPTDRVILNFGWAKHYNTPIFYKNYPFLSFQAAQVLMDKGVRLLGYDTPSPDDPNHNKDAAEDSPIHKAFLSSGMWLVEYLNNLEGLPETIQLCALPLPLVGVDGAPARCIGITNDR